ncbi:MAG TPA: carbohydrate ABC transporter permease [Candidatus Limnocylindrales bacterium]|jgi:multiple sugar transport system permease protein
MATTEAVRPLRVATPRRRGPRRLLTRSILPRIILIIAAIVFLAPFYWMVVSALKTNQEAVAFPPTFVPQSWAWQNFADAVSYIPFGLYALNSTIITVGATIGAVLSNTVIAYGFSRIQWPGRNVLFYICVATIFLPYPVVLVALFDIFSKLPSFGIQGGASWVNTFLPLIVPAFFGNPFYIFLMRQFMMGIPRELSDAARVDGASEVQTFWNVILPLTKPAVTVIAILAAVAAWNEFLLPLLYLQENTKYPLAVGLAFFTSEHDVAYNLLMAAATLIVLPIVVLFLFFQRFFIEGITVGGVKG